MADGQPIRNNPTYGDTWAEIVTGLTGGSAQPQRAATSPATFTLAATGGPTAAGEQEYSIFI